MRYKTLLWIIPLLIVGAMLSYSDPSVDWDNIDFPYYYNDEGFPIVIYSVVRIFTQSQLDSFDVANYDPDCQPMQTINETRRYAIRRNCTSIIKDNDRYIIVRANYYSQYIYKNVLTDCIESGLPRLNCTSIMREDINTFLANRYQMQIAKIKGWQNREYIEMTDEELGNIRII